MSFDFTNYTFSGLLSILASLYGVGYPLIVQSIGKIYTLYDSQRLSERFVKEPVYKCFQILMIANMVAAVTAPFLLMQQVSNVLIIVIQALLIMMLVADSLLLFRLILVYQDGKGLLKLVRGNKIDKDNVLAILDISIYADAHHNYPLYSESLTDVFAYITKQQGDQPNQSYQSVLPPVFYDAITTEIILKIKDFLKSDDGHHFLYGNNDIVAVMFNQSSASRISLQCHQWMWILVSEAVSNNNHAWFSQYWQFADSYASIKYRFVGYDSPLNHDRMMFMMRHVMIGAMLIHHGRERWLNETFFYTHSEPEYYGLIPSRFGDIIQMLEMIDMMCSDSRYYFQQGFYFKDQMGGVKADRYAFREALTYLSLLVIRLWSLEGRNMFYGGNEFALPASPKKLKDDEREVQLIEMMKQEVKHWIGKDVFNIIPRMTEVNYETVAQLLDSYKNQCTNDKQQKEEHPQVSLSKYEVFKNAFVNLLQRVGENLPKIEEYNDGISSETFIEKEELIKTIDFSSYVDMGVGAVPEVICTNYKYDVDRAYLDFLEGQKTVGAFMVPRKQITSILDAMGFDEQYAIIVTEEFAELQDADVILEAMYRPIFFYVVKKDEIPSAKLLPIIDDKLKPYRDGGTVYSNIEEFQSHQDPEFRLTMKCKLRCSIPKDFSGFVRFMVDDNYLRQDVKITPNKTFGELFASRII